MIDDNIRNGCRFATILSLVCIFFVICFGIFYFFDYVDLLNLSYFNRIFNQTVSKFVYLDTKLEDSHKNSNTFYLDRKIRDDTYSFLTKEQIQKLSILELPSNTFLQSEYKGIKILGSGNNKFTENQIDLIKYFLDIAPDFIIKNGPTAIVMISRSYAESKTLNTNIFIDTKAYASGTYVFFDEYTFENNSEYVDNSIDSHYKTFIHEAMHVVHFNIALFENIHLINSEDYTWSDIVLSSSFTKDFALKVGWEFYPDGKSYSYTLVDNSKISTTDYGKKSIIEDIAETVASVLTDETREISQNRIDWVYNLMKLDKQKIYNYVVPFYSCCRPILRIDNLEYDSSYEVAFANKYKFVNHQQFQSYQDVEYNFQMFANKIVSDLNNRGWDGQLKFYREKNNILKQKGLFVSKYRDMYIEIISFENAKGYQNIPAGYIILVISGYIRMYN